MSGRVRHGDGGSAIAKAAGVAAIVAAVLLAPVVAIVGGTALAAAVSGRGDRPGGKQ